MASRATATGGGARMPLAVAFAVIVLGLLAGCASRPAQPEKYSPLILISFDGYRPDYLDRGLSPNLAALAAGGVRAQAMRPSFPTLTFPNHYTIVTGLYPDHHGIVDNRMVDPASGKRFVYNDYPTTTDSSWWGGEPLWVAAEKQGKRAATMYWPGSDVEIAGSRPRHWRRFDANVPPQARVDQALAWLDLPPGERPDFMTLYFDQTDHAGHWYGPASAEVGAVLAEVDAALGSLVEGLERRGIYAATNLVIVSDHGIAPSGPDQVVTIDRVVDMDDVDVVSGVLASITPKPGHEARAEAALLEPRDHMRCWRKADLPARLHYGTNARIAPLLCLADDGWIIFTQKFLDRPGRHISVGEHGYDNDDPNMRALFVAHGPAFKQRLVVPEFDNVDVYSLLAHVLHLKAAANDGDYRTVAPMLVDP